MQWTYQYHVMPFIWLPKKEIVIHRDHIVSVEFDFMGKTAVIYTDRARGAGDMFVVTKPEDMAALEKALGLEVKK